MKDKKKITALLAAITIALSKGYSALNENGGLPEVDKDTLPVLAPHIVKGLKASLVEIEENARFEGMSYEKIIEKRETEKQEAIQRNLDDAGEALKALRAVPEPVESGEELDESNQNEVAQDSTGSESDLNEDAQDSAGSDEDSEREADDQLLLGYSMSELETMKTELKNMLTNFDSGSTEYQIGVAKLATIDNFIDKLKDQVKAQE